MAAQFRQFVEYVAQTLAEQPERVQVEELPAQGDEAPGSRLRLVVAPDDVGRIVGRRGRTAKAIRTVLAAAGTCELEIAGSAEERDDDDGDELDDD